MYIRCGEQFAILSGPLMQNVGRTPGERKAVIDAIERQGAICQWVDDNTWQELFRQSASYRQSASTPHHLTTKVAPT